MPRIVPNISTEMQDGYAILLGHNFDTLQENFNVSVSPPQVAWLELKKEQAAEKETPVKAEFGGEIFQIWMGASQGKKWVLENDDFQFHIGSPKQNWPLTVRYSAAGLWEHGVDKMRRRAREIIAHEFFPICGEGEGPGAWQRVSQVHYAFDFYSPDFTQEMQGGNIRKKILVPSGVKGKIFFSSLWDETLNLGENRNGLVIQVYNKGKEITDKSSGKTWMYKVWEQAGYFPPENEKGKNVWRVEIRFGKEYLRNRGILTFENAREVLSNLLAEALMTRRMVSPPGTGEHRERWPLHPLWAATYDASGRAGEYTPIGRQITLRRDAMIATLESQITGTARSLATLTGKNGEYDGRMAASKMESCADAIEEDPDHILKVERAKERYRFIEEAR